MGAWRPCPAGHGGALGDGRPGGPHPAARHVAGAPAPHGPQQRGGPARRPHLQPHGLRLLVPQGPHGRALGAPARAQPRRALSAHPELAQAYSDHSPVATVLPWFRRAYAYAEKSLRLRQDLGDEWGQGQSLHFYGIALYTSGRFEECMGRCREAVRLLERTGDQWEVNNALFNQAMALYRLGRLKEALAVAQRLHANGARHRRSLLGAAGAGGAGQGHRRPGPRTPCSSRSWTTPPRIPSPTRASSWPRACGSCARETPRARWPRWSGRTGWWSTPACARSSWPPCPPGSPRRCVSSPPTRSALAPGRRDALLKRALDMGERAHKLARTYRNNLAPRAARAGPHRGHEGPPPPRPALAGQEPARGRGAGHAPRARPDPARARPGGRGARLARGLARTWRPRGASSRRWSRD